MRYLTFLSVCRCNSIENVPEKEEKVPRSSNEEKCMDAEKGCGTGFGISLFSNRDHSRELNYRRNTIGGPRRVDFFRKRDNRSLNK